MLEEEPEGCCCGPATPVPTGIAGDVEEDDDGGGCVTRSFNPLLNTNPFTLRSSELRKSAALNSPTTLLLFPLPADVAVGCDFGFLITLAYVASTG